MQILCCGMMFYQVSPSLLLCVVCVCAMIV